MERGRIEPGSKCKAACGSKEKKARTAAKAEQGIGQNESADVPKHEGMTDGVPCCLEFLLSDQPDFKLQQNAIQELIISRGHLCIFLPKYHPELNFIERYWPRVKWYARQKCDQTIKGLRTATNEALSEKACDLALIQPLLPDGVAVGLRLPKGAGRGAGVLGGAQVEVPPVCDRCGRPGGEQNGGRTDG